MSKKAKAAKQEKTIEDATFGLKNKNKSKKVQNFIQNVNKSVKNTNKANDTAKEAKKNAKLAKELQEAELAVLFNEGLSGQFGASKKAAAANAEAAGLSEAEAKLQQAMEELEKEFSSDDESDDNSGEYYIVDNFEEDEGGVEVFQEKTIEDVIEEQRAALVKEGKIGTPITEVSFAKWKQDKKLRKQRELEERVRIENMKKKGGKGLCKFSLHSRWTLSHTISLHALCLTCPLSAPINFKSYSKRT